MAIHTTDAPLPSPATKSRPGSDNLEAEAIGLEVPVLIHGSQVTAVVMETTEHAEPFEEETATMIVFPRGAVIKLLARVRTGHVLVLTNLRSHQDALCKVIQVNTVNANSVHYVKLEFVQASPGFWGVHFPSDPLPSARPKEKSSPAPVAPKLSPPAAAPASPAIPSSQTHDAPASIISVDTAEPASLAHAALASLSSLVKESPADPPPAIVPPAPAKISTPPASKVAPAAKSQLPEMTFPASLVSTSARRESSKMPPATQESSKISLPAPNQAPAAPKAAGYGLSRNWQKEAIEPLAGAETAPPADETKPLNDLASSPMASSTMAEKIPAPVVRPKTERPAVARPAAAKPLAKPANLDRPVFGTLHTFSSAPAADTEIAPLPEIPAEKIERQVRSRSKTGYVRAAIFILVVSAAGALYVRRNPSFLAKFTHPAQNQQTQAASATAPPAMNPLQASNPAPIPSTAPLETTASVPAVNHGEAENKPPAAAENSPDAASGASREKSLKPAGESRPSAEDAAEETKPAASKAPADIFAGAANAKPKIAPRRRRSVEAPLPNVAAAAPAGGAAAADANALGSLVPGADTGLAAPPVPANSAPEVRQGGVIVQPKLIFSVPPVYPALAKQAGVEGDVEIQAQIGISGNVTSMKVISGPSLLRGAAMDALRRWRYLPAKLDGKPIAQPYVVTIRFRLHQ
jgi:protein TonB